MEDELSTPMMIEGFTVVRFTVLIIGEISRKASNVTETNLRTASDQITPFGNSAFLFLKKYSRTVTPSPKAIQKSINHQGYPVKSLKSNIIFLK